MPTRRNIILVALFAVILSTLINESGESISAQAECLLDCGLAREERSKTEIQVSRSLSCDECLKRMKDRHTLPENNFIQRKRRSLLDHSNCVHWTDDESVPGLTVPSEVHVTFGQYENTSYWYVNISWTPINVSYGYLNGIVLRLSLVSQLELYCIVLPKNQTFFSINLSFYGYNYPEYIFLQVLGIPYRDKIIPIKGYLPAIPGSPSPTTLTEATAGSPSPTTLTEATDCVPWTDDESETGLTVPSEVQVTFGQYESTNYWYVNISWTPIKVSYGYLNGIALRLSIANQPITCIVLPKNQTFFSLNLSFYGYNYPEPIFLQVLGIPNRYQIISMKYPPPDISGSPSPTTLTEATGIPASLNRSKLSTTEAGSPSPTTLTEATEIPAYLSSTKLSTTEGSNNTNTYVSIAAGILVGIFALCLLKYIRRRKRSLPVPSEFDYHAFIIYSTDDEYWVDGLLHYLEDKLHLKCCIHYRDFEAGLPYVDNIVNSIEKSYKIIAVYSENFLNSKDSIYELNRAKFRLLKKNDNSLVIIRIDGADCKELPPELRERSFIDYHTVLERPLWRRRLRTFLEVSGDSSDQSATMDNNNSCNCHTTLLIENGQNRVRTQFNRLDSTSSSNTVESFV